MPENPHCIRDDAGFPLVERKMGLVLWLDEPPSPRLARSVYDIYMHRCGERVRGFCSTAPGSLVLPWTTATRQTFEDKKLPALRRHRDWGYGFADDQEVDSWLFMFHGARPQSEPDRASFFRFDFPWDIDPAFLLELALAVAGVAPYRSGFAGPYFQIRIQEEAPSLDHMYALARRYWGIEAHHLDVTSWHMRHGIKCVNWLTLIGAPLIAAHPDELRRARAAAFAAHETRYGLVLQAEERPRVIDRNLNEPLGGYAAVAGALRPLQVEDHAGFGGDRWTDDETRRYLRRFTDP